MAGGHAHPWNDLYRLEEAVAERVVLETAPRDSTLQSYVITRAAQRTLSLITERMDSGTGDGFWLGDPSGAGKTHFLNYLLALRSQLARAQDRGREVVLAFDCAGPGSGARLETELLAAMAEELGAERRGTPLWRRVGAAAGLQIALSEARRAGVRAVTIVVDFGANPAPAFASDLTQIARGSRHPSIVLVAAGTAAPPPDAVVTQVGPADVSEHITIAVARARSLDPRWSTMARLYQGIELQPFAAAEIFPFHPETLREMAALVRPLTIAGLARSVRDLLSVHKADDCLVYPCELFDVAEIRRMIDQRLEAEGRQALRDAEAAVRQSARARRHLAEQIVRTLALAHICGKRPALEFGELSDLLPPVHGPGQHWTKAAPDALREILRELAKSSSAIASSPVGAVFVPARKADMAVEQFNAALPLLRLFDPGVQPVALKAELEQALARIDRSLSALIEEALGVSQTLDSFARACGTHLDAGVRHTIDAFVEILNRGASGLLKRGADSEEDHAARTAWAAYRETAAAAAFVPALITMKEYLERTRLQPDQLDFHDRPEAALAAERRLLEAELGPQAPYSRSRDSLQARFEKFKWTYIEQYRAAHERWRTEMQNASRLLLDINRSLDALLRLDSIPALGPPAGAQFAASAQDLRERVRICPLEEPFDALSVPICPECGYVLGTAAPAPGLTQRLDSIRRALSEKLTMLSRGAIARLIKKYDKAHRLDGFLKITQAAQTEALAAVLDDQLTAYIARLLEQRDDGQANRKASR